MKFTNGYWLIREGYTMNYSEQIRSYEIHDDCVVLYLPFKKISHKGDTLNIGMTTLILDSPKKNIIRVNMKHFDQDLNDAKFEITESKEKLSIDDNNDAILIHSGNVTVRVNKGDNFSLDFLRDGKLVTSSKYRSQAFVNVDDKNYYRDQLTIKPDEYIYGLGERFTPFVKNGQVVDIWNEDSGASSEQTYINIPFYISNKGYGIFVNNAGKVSYEVASEDVAKVQFSVEGEEMEYFFLDGGSMNETLSLYASLTGYPALPPAWSFGLWLSTSFCTDYGEETVLDIFDKMDDHETPFEVFHFDCFWMKEFEWMNFEWNPAVFPNPKSLLKKIHDKGKKVSLWINPYVAQKAPVFKELKEKGYLLKQENGQVWQWDMWQSGMGLIDFTNPGAVEWYKNKLGELIDMGVDTFKTDFGERIPVDNVVYFDKSNPKSMHNYYSYLYNKTVFELLKEKFGKNEALVFARSGTVGSQSFPVHWGGDNLSEYTSMIDSLRGGLSLMLSGFAYWSHDIGGFEDNTTKDIYKRWTQFGLLSSHSRYHANIEYRLPWMYGEEAVSVTKKFAEFKNSIMPYIYAKANDASRMGTPLMRPMVLDFTEDPTTHVLDRQYMFGPDLLVAPIFNDQGDVQYYLPKGVWHHVLTDEYVDSIDGKWLNENYDYLNLPLYVRENSILVFGTKNRAEYDYLDNVEINLYNPQKGITVHEFNYPNTNGEITVNYKEDKITLSFKNYTNIKKCNVYIRDKKYECEAKGNTASIEL